MKKLILSALLLITINCFSQTTSEKWNSLYERYEYRDNNGNLVGYKRYNSLNGSWEYTNVNNYSQYDNSGYNNNLILLDKALAAKQERYDNNKVFYDKGVIIIQREIDSYRRVLKSENATEGLKKFNEEIEIQIYGKNHNYSELPIVNGLIKYLKTLFKYIAENYDN